MRTALVRCPGSLARRPRAAAAVLAGCAAVASVLLPVTAATAATAEVTPLPQSGSVAVYGRGAGHGHGLSQYGARHAADIGLSANDILAFYYPSTQRTVLADSRIRVKLSGVTANTTVFATTAGLRLCQQQPLPLSGIQYYRLAPYGSSLALQRWRIGGTSWETVTTNLSSGTCFASDRNYERVLNADGSSTYYHGYVRAFRSGAGEITTNNVSLDEYAAGVAPREMPASWALNAVRAQAIAARSYGRYAVEHSWGSDYDICDTTSCQVYGGMARVARDGTVDWREDTAAVVGNENTVVTYGGHTIFAQFGASNGGEVADGGQPYLVAKNDPYDIPSSGDPYLLWKRTSTAQAVASYYGLKQATAIEITKRDGYGPWGGRVQDGYVDGVTYSGAKVRWATSGDSLGAALGMYTTYFRIGTPG